MLASTNETVTLLNEVDPWDVITDIGDEIGQDETEPYLDSLQAKEVSLNEDIFSAYNILASVLYDNQYGGMALDEEGNAWFNGALLAMRVGDQIGTIKGINPIDIRSFMLQSKAVAPFISDTPVAEEVISCTLASIRDIGQMQSYDGFVQVCIGVGQDIFADQAPEVSQPLYDALLHGFRFTLNQSTRALATIEINRIVATLMHTEISG